MVQGQTDSRLTEAGRRSAESVALKVRDCGVGSIYSSPLERAWTTASIISEATDTPVRALPGLMDRHWGISEGRPEAECPEEYNPKTAETVEAFSSRVLTALASIGGANPVLVVAHSGVFRVLMQHIGALKDGNASIDGGQLVRIEPPTMADKGWRVLKMDS